MNSECELFRVSRKRSSGRSNQKKSGQGENLAEFTFIQDDPKTKKMWFHRVDKFSSVIVVAIRNDGLVQEWGMSATHNYRNRMLTSNDGATSYASLFRCNQKNLW